MIHERYINLFTDFGFKRIFGTESNKDLLIDFLNAVLERHDNPIIDLSYLKNELLGKTQSDRKSIFDLYCESKSQEKFIIELQRVEQEFFKDRALYYSSFSIQEQGKRGKGWDYELLPIYMIGIMDFEFEKEHSDYRTLVKLVNTQTQAVFYDKLTFLFLEMPKFTKERHQLSSNTDKWLYVLKNMHKLAEMPSEVQEGVFSKLFEQCEIVNYNAEDSMAYEESVKIYNDWYSITQTAKKKGIEEGITIGKAEGLAEGIRITVENAIKKGLDDMLISELTGLSVSEIGSIRKKM